MKRPVLWPVTPSSAAKWTFEPSPHFPPGTPTFSRWIPMVSSRPSARGPLRSPLITEACRTRSPSQQFRPRRRSRTGIASTGIPPTRSGVPPGMARCRMGAISLPRQAKCCSRPRVPSSYSSLRESSPTIPPSRLICGHRCPRPCRQIVFSGRLAIPSGVGEVIVFSSSPWEGDWRFPAACRVGRPESKMPMEPATSAARRTSI